MSEKVAFESEGFAGQLLSDVSFNPEDMENAIYEQAALYSFYAHQAMLAQQKADKVDLKIDLETAKLDATIRERFLEEGTKVTEKAIEQEIARDVGLTKLKTKYIELKALATFVRDNLEALKHRRDMLIQISVSNREDGKGALRVMDRAAREDVLREQREAYAAKMKAS